MARPEPLSDNEVLNFLGRTPKPAGVREIIAGLGLRNAARRALAKTLSRLKHRKLVEELRGGRYRLVVTNPAASAPANIKPEKTRTVIGCHAVFANLRHFSGGRIFYCDGTSLPSLISSFAGEITVSPDFRSPTTSTNPEFSLPVVTLTLTARPLRTTRTYLASVEVTTAFGGTASAPRR